MNLAPTHFRQTIVGVLLFLFWTVAAPAQSVLAGCALEQVAGTARQTLHCRDGLVIIAEAGARFKLVDRDGDGVADAARLNAGALLLDAPNPPEKTGFEVVTPQAIAAVRGTKWAVDVGAGKTSVFVIRGQVAVRRTAGGDGVQLGPGDGVDVTEAGGALTVKRWPAARVSALLARFGQ